MREKNTVLAFIAQTTKTIPFTYQKTLTRIHFFCKIGNVKAVQDMINSGKMKVNCKDNYGAKTVLIAASKGNLHLLKTLIINGCNFLVVDHHGNKILHRVCLEDDVRVVEFVLSLSKIDINSRGLLRRTPVMNAVHQGHLHIVKLLVNKGCDLTITDAFRNNVLHLACEGNNQRMVKCSFTSIAREKMA